MLETREDLLKILQEDRIIDDPDLLETYSRDESFTHPLKPWYLVKPENVKQVEDLIALANRTNTPLVPVSSGGPHFRGDTVPTAPGAIIVDLSGMKKIVHLDVRNRMVIIEPGVTYTELQPYLAKYGLRISSPLQPRCTKSVVASLLEREPIVIPRYQWALQDPLRCEEVVWGDGQRITTGEAGSLGTIEQEWEKKLAQVNYAGPGQSDFYKFTSAAQGSMGIVTWTSVKCELLPSIHKMYFVTAPALAQLQDLAYDILRVRFGDELLLLNRWNLASLIGKDSANIKSLAEQLPAWILLVGIAGRERLPRERVAFQEKDISDMVQHYGLELVPALPCASGDTVLEAVLNPSGETYWKMMYKGSCQEIFFISTLEKAQDFVQAMYKVIDGLGYPSSEMGVYVQPVHQGSSCHIEFDLPFDRSNSKELARMQDVYQKASAEMNNQGAYFSRPYGIWSEMAFNRDARSTEAIKKIKGIFDPNNILNPGKLCF